ncbi:MAG: hypothetical protein GX801_05900 [Fibrobacter sp.]|nr:hypothetical protein [Fibrobacter sp.]
MQNKNNNENPRDYSDRNVLLLEIDEEHSEITAQIIRNMLPGAKIKAVHTPEDALKAMHKGEWDTYVLDFREEAVSNSEFVKRANNQKDAVLVALPFGTFTEGDEDNAAKLDILRKLFEVEKEEKKK